MTNRGGNGASGAEVRAKLDHPVVDDGFIDASDFRDLSYVNVVRMHTAMNPEFFKGTIVEDAVERLKGEAPDANAQ